MVSLGASIMAPCASKKTSLGTREERERGVFRQTAISRMAGEGRLVYERTGTTHPHPHPPDAFPARKVLGFAR